MKRTLLVLALALPALAAAQAPAKPAAAANGPVATVNGVAVPRQRFDVVIRQLSERGQKDSEQLRAQVRENLVNNELLNQEAARTGITKKADLQQLIELNRQEVIANAVLTEYLRTHPVTDADIQKEYDRAKQQTGDREYRARHILVKTEDEAKGIIAELKKGGKFDEIAQKRSMDEGSRPKGGDLDWNVPSNFDKGFADAMVKLEKGKYTEVPARSRFGYHVILLEDVRPVNFPPMAQVKSQLQQMVSRQRVEALLRDLRAKAKIVE
jgi:peptidyl-prolyl cis-trans isomerase C